MHSPPTLALGARVALVAPAGPLRDHQDLDRSIANVSSFGWVAVPGDHVLERDGYLAGSDADRLADLNRFLRDDSVDAIWCIRGGYGAMRLLEGIDYDALARRPKAIIGYSDITALHAAIGRRCGLVSYHGATARAELTELTRRSVAAVLGESWESLTIAHPSMTTLERGTARGRLAGGNLALLAALAGTPFMPELDGAILLLEDVGEAVYRIDRMLTQLWLSGALRNVAGLAFGSFTEIPEDQANVQRPVERVLEEFAARCGVPCVSGFPMGHIDDQYTYPLGAIATLNADEGLLVIER
ncbi:MAG TPA: LD-carboxypeptidase [Gemmatimonadaceae bacterium]